LAVGVLNNMRDEFEVYFQFLFDALTYTPTTKDDKPEVAQLNPPAISPADQAKLADLTIKFRQAFYNLTVKEQIRVGLTGYEQLGRAYAQAEVELRKFILEKTAAAAPAPAPTAKGKQLPSAPVFNTTVYKRKLALDALNIINGLVKETALYVSMLNVPIVPSVGTVKSTEAPAEFTQAPKKAANARKNKGK
jgi:hypothetical protein